MRPIEQLETRCLLSAALIADVNTNPATSNPDNLVWAQDKLFFTASTEAHGTELWVSDSAGAHLIKDINPGTSGGATVTSMVANGGTVYFTANDPAGGRELWRSDGTSGGTVRVKDITAGTAGTSITALSNVDGKLLFLASSSTGGYDLWKSDGSDAGTVKLAGHWNAYSGQSAVCNGSLYFVATDAAHGSELWRSDGTDGGTVLVKDIKAGVGGSSASWLAATGNLLFFRADDGNHLNGLWRSDGTEAGTYMVKFFSTWAGETWPTELTGVGNRLYFAADDGTGRELWTSDGTAAGTYLVKDIIPGSNGSSPSYLVAMGSVLYFQAGDGYADRAIWRSDGTETGTYAVKNPQRADAPYFPSGLTVAGSNVYFVSLDNELWKTDGTSDGTVLLKTFGFEPDSAKYFTQNLTAAGDRLYFTASDGIDGTIGYELWTTDGTAAGTSLVKDIVPGTYSGQPGDFVVAGNHLFFSGHDGLHGREPWRTNGTPDGSVPLGDIWPGNEATSSNPEGVEFKGQYYFHAQYDSAGTYHPEGIFRSDGTPGGAVRIAGDLNVVGNLTPTASTLFFTARVGYLDSGLFKVDPGGTSVSRVGAFIFPQQLTAIGDVLYFVVDDGNRGKEVWRTDGTDAGTFNVKDIQPGAAHSHPNNLIAAGSTLYFTATDPALGRSLWRSDGTPAGTIPLAPIPVIQNSTAVSSISNVNGTIFFATGGGGSVELWKSDGTTAGTMKVLGGMRYVGPMTAVGNTGYFAGESGLTGVELWKTDGTAAGTVLVKDINSSGYYVPSLPTELTHVGGRLYFTANDPVNGQRIWQSDGTEAGTVIATPIAAGPAGANFSHQLVSFNDALYFTGTDGSSGIELFRLVPETGMIRFSAATYEVNESAGTATITLTREGGSSGAVSVDYSTSNGSGVAGSDYTPVSGTITFADGESTRSFNVPILNDAGGEVAESVNLHLSNPTGGALLGTRAAVLAIVDDDFAGSIGFSSSMYAASENGGSASITLVRTGGSSGSVSVSLSTSDGSAIAGADYTAVSSTIAFANGEIIKTIALPITNDVAVENDETINLALAGPTGGATLGTAAAVLTIQDSDVAAVSVGDVSVVEGNDGQGSGVFFVSLSTPLPADFTVQYATAGGSAAADSDFRSTSGMLTIPAGQTSGAIQVTVFGDALAEPNESFTLALYNPVGRAALVRATATGTIVTDDISDTIAPTAQIAAVSPNPRSTAVPAMTINFSEAVTGLDLLDLSLTRNAGANLLTSSQTLTSANGINFTLGNLSGVTGTAGNYVLTVKAVGSGVADAADNPLFADATAAWSYVPAGTLGIAATSNPVTGKTASLSVVNGGTNTSTVFTWSVAAEPAGANAPTFNRNKSNAARTTTVTFSKAGSYALKLTSTTGTTVKTATVTAVVQQTLTSVAVSPATATIFNGTTKQLAATAKDQFGAAMVPQPAFSWSIDAGGVGTVGVSGLYAAPAATAGAAKVRASVGSVSAVATITVITTAKVNFQPSAAPKVSGYLADAGNTYAARNGQSYGWSVSHTANVVDRNKNSNQLLDTNVAIRTGGKWELAVANGTYTVKLSVGDAAATTTNTIRVEGSTVLSAVKLAANVFSNKLVTVSVTDGRLTIDPGSAASLATRLNYLEIGRVG